MKEKNIKGITLVALVITIVILLILAGISIQAITNTGLFTKAQQAKEETAKKEEEEQTVMNGYQDAIDQYASGISNDNGGWNSTKKVNSPRLMEGMTGVYWDETGKEVEVTSANKDNWYNYDNQKWANAKTEDGSYWVWIPRYAYKIESGCYTNTSGEISIKFLQGTSNKDSEGNEISTKYPTVTSGKMENYVVHPSFTNGTANNYMNGEWDKELTGYWVAKYAAGYQECTQTVASNGSITEPTTNTSNIKYSDKKYTYNDYSSNAISQNLKSLPQMSYPVFKPLTYAYNCITTGDIYTLTQEIAKAKDFYGLNAQQTDSHQMKNSEWGAVAYLTQSKYGRNKTEVTINSKNMNNSSKNIYAVTGYANTTANDNSASTTNNKTGIFDLSGCVWEYTASYVSNGHANINSYGKSYASVETNSNGYKTLSTKYATVYPYDSNNLGATYNNLKSETYGFGDAILETSNRSNTTNSWNGDYSDFPFSSVPFFLRGGDYGGSSYAGTFAFSSYSGGTYNSYGFRSVLVAL